MNTEFGNKTGTAAQADYSRRRHTPCRDDLELSAAGEAWLASLDASVWPIALVDVFPRIVNRMAKLWRMPREMDRYFEDLLTDTRGHRQGFPLDILMELSTLKDYYQTQAFPPSARRDVWDDSIDSWNRGGRLRA